MQSMHENVDDVNTRREFLDIFLSSPITAHRRLRNRQISPPPPPSSRSLEVRPLTQARQETQLRSSRKVCAVGCRKLRVPVKSSLAYEVKCGEEEVAYIGTHVQYLP